MSSAHTNAGETLTDGPLRAIQPQWNGNLIAASIAISLLGAFTSTQLMCQARTSYHFSACCVWTLLSSITFGFCSVWCLHEVAMLACELDLPVAVKPGLTTLSALLATGFTFVALSGDLLWDRWTHSRRKARRRARRRKDSEAEDAKATRKTSPNGGNMWSILPSRPEETVPTIPLEETTEEPPEPVYTDEDEDFVDETAPLTQNIALQETAVLDEEEDISDGGSTAVDTVQSRKPRESDGILKPARLAAQKPGTDADFGTDVRTQAAFIISQEEPRRPSVPRSESENSSARSLSNASSFGLNSLVNVAWLRGSKPTQNIVVLTVTILWAGFTKKNILKGFLWSLAITSMHYVGIAGLAIPHGFYKLDPFFFLASALISWIVCLVGCIFMAQMETHLPQQILFSVVAASGVAAMHFTGMRAVTFYSTALPSENRGYPPELAVAVASIAIVTCIAANGLLAHSATVSRNKLAEIVLTRKQLWRTIAQKENAEAAAAARSDFIASASHEIRTPLHHLQGYSDLLSRTELTEEGRMLLACIQRATQTLSLITNNVLDWSRLEKDSEGICRPIALDIRTVCESVIILLPNKDDEAEVELLVVVAPDVPHSLFLDETYIHRILMNLLSNSLKFTRSGYISLVIEMKDGNLVASVKDTGIGIPPSFLPSCFEPFKQAQTRGSQRGTGLGLSIIKQLLSKMGGSIDVESKYFEEPDVDASETGSIFTITLPVQTVTTTPHDIPEPIPSPTTVAIFHAGNARASTGIALAWSKSGYNPVICTHLSDLAQSDWAYIWADLPALKADPTLLNTLLKRTNTRVLIPCDTLTSPQELLQLQSPPAHFIYLPKPLIWHTFNQRIQAALEPTPVAKEVRFASEVSVIANKPTSTPAPPSENAIPESLELSKITTAPATTSKPALTKSLSTPAPSKGTILLVEDNPINQKLGQRMLRTLNYTTLVANDGVEALEVLSAHDDVIDAILMDQSMPRKDGLTATKEIRQLETSGVLGKNKPCRPIIAVTAVVSSEAEKAFRDVGADGFLAKPLSLKKLEETLDRCLRDDCVGTVCFSRRGSIMPT